MDNLTILTVNFNTPEYIFALSKSLIKFFPEYKNSLIVVDNSTKKVYAEGTYNNLKIVYFDNNNYKELEELKPSKYPAAGNYNSAHHSLTLDWSIKNLVKTDYLLLLDSDIVFTKQIKPYYDEFVKNDYALYGFKRTTYKCPTIAPWCCFINVKKMRELNINYYDFNRILYVNDNLTHDTGASLYEDFIKAGCKIKETQDNYFWLHFKGGSVFKDRGMMWLKQHSQYWK